jgi:hypothetical protein
VKFATRTLVLATATLALAGCTTINLQSGTGMGGGMMAGGGSYQQSRLTCAAPTDLPGARVTVMLGDMGMTRMMSGTAPLGAPMMLRATPATVSAGQVSFVVQNMGWRTHELLVLPLAAGASA